jgi:hypothetical protein
MHQYHYICLSAKKLHYQDRQNVACQSLDSSLHHCYVLQHELFSEDTFQLS